MAKIGPTPTPPPGGQPQGPHPAVQGKPFHVGPPSKIPDNLGQIMKQYPKIGHEFYQSLIIGLAMKMMQELRKHAKLKKDER